MIENILTNMIANNPAIGEAIKGFINTSNDVKGRVSDIDAKLELILSRVEDITKRLDNIDEQITLIKRVIEASESGNPIIW